MIKVVIFDCDGVLLELRLFSDRYIEKYHIPPTIMMRFFETEFENIVVGKQDLKRVLKKYVQDWNWKKSIDELVNYWLSEDVVDTRILQFINKLKQKGIKVYLGSNQERYRAEYIGTALGFKNIFHETYFSHELGRKKPSADFYRKVWGNVKKHHPHLQKSETMIVDDENDNIETAKKLGFLTHLYRNFNAFKKEMDNILEKDKV